MNTDIKAIKRKLFELRLPLSKLTVPEYINYLNHRIINLVTTRYVLSDAELKYLLCETGPGNIRFDPEIVGLHLTSKNNTLDISVKHKVVGKNHFLLNPETSEENLADIIMAKSRLLKTISSRNTQKKVLELLANQIESVAQKCSVSLSELLITQNTIEFVIEEKALVRYFTNQWIYLHHREMWQLLEKAHELNLGAIILSPKIHGICFPVFKKIGLFGSNTYTLYLLASSLKEIDEFNSFEWAYKVTCTPGNLASVDHDSQILRFFQSDLSKLHPPGAKLTKETVAVLSSLDGQENGQFAAFRTALKPALDKHLHENISEWLERRAKLIQEISVQ